MIQKCLILESPYQLLFFLPHFSESNMYSANMVRQYSFLNQLISDLENDASKVCELVMYACNMVRITLLT